MKIDSHTQHFRKISYIRTNRKKYDGNSDDENQQEENKKLLYKMVGNDYFFRGKIDVKKYKQFLWIIIYYYYNKICEILM